MFWDVMANVGVDIVVCSVGGIESVVIDLRLGEGSRVGRVFERVSASLKEYLSELLAKFLGPVFLAREGGLEGECKRHCRKETNGS